MFMDNIFDLTNENSVMPKLCPAECSETIKDGLLSCICPSSFLSTIFSTTLRACPRGCKRRANNTCDCSTRQEAEANVTRNLGLIILGALLLSLLLYTTLNVIARLRRCKRMRNDLDDDEDDNFDNDGDVSVCNIRHPGRNAIRQTYITSLGPDQSEERSEVVHYTSRVGSPTEYPIILQEGSIPPPYSELGPKDMPPPYESLYFDSSNPGSRDINNNIDSNNDNYDDDSTDEPGNGSSPTIQTHHNRSDR